MRYLLTTWLSLCAVLIPPSLQADTKVFPATICQVWGAHKHLAEYLSYSQFGKVSNTHPNQKIGVVCPLLRDRPDRPMDLSVYWADRYDGNGSNNRGVLTCVFRANSVWGNSSLASSFVASNNWGEAEHAINEQGFSEGLYGRFWWTNLTGGNTVLNYDTTTYTLFCQIPPTFDVSHDETRESYIGSITLVEN